MPTFVYSEEDKGPFGEVEFLINPHLPFFPLLHIFPEKGLYQLESIHSQYDHFHKGGKFMFFLAKYIPLSEDYSYAF